jgi:hypothetical protein
VFAAAAANTNTYVCMATIQDVGPDHKDAGKPVLILPAEAVFA